MKIYVKHNNRDITKKQERESTTTSTTSKNINMNTNTNTTNNVDNTVKANNPIKKAGINIYY